MHYQGVFDAYEPFILDHPAWFGQSQVNDVKRHAAQGQGRDLI